jgi:hypothetical protein
MYQVQYVWRKITNFITFSGTGSFLKGKIYMSVCERDLNRLTIGTRIFRIWSLILGFFKQRTTTYFLDITMGTNFSKLPQKACSNFSFIKYKKTPWSESASEVYRPSGRSLSAKLVPTFADRGCHVISVTDPYGRILGFLDRSRYCFLKVAPHLYSRG